MAFIDFLLPRRSTGLRRLAQPIAGASPADVDFIAGTQSRVAEVVAKVPRTGRLVAAKMRKDPWMARVSTYRQFVGPE
eukprot:8872223-Prorocentrum_lima.AAC.1